MKWNRKSKNLSQVAKGHAEQAAGTALDDEQLVAEGRDDQMAGHLKQAAEKIKDAYKN